MSLLPMPPQASNEDIDLAAAQALFQRRRQLAQQLQQQAMQPLQGQVVSGHYVGPGKLAGLAQLLSGLAGQRLEKDLDAKEGELSARRKQMLEAGLTRYFDTREGRPDQPMGPPTEDGQYGVQPGVKANPRRAAIEAIVSSMPELRQLGAMDLQNIGKAEAETFGTTPVRTQDGRTIVLGNRGGMRELPVQLPGEKPLVMGDKAVDPRDPSRVLADHGDRWETFQRGSKTYRKNLRTGREELVDTGTTVNVDTQGNKEALSQQGAVLKEARTQAIAAKDTRETAVRVMQALDDPRVMTGFAANVQTGVAALAKKMGWDDKQAVAKTQALAADLAKNVLNNAAALKPLSDSDIKFLRDVTGGNIAVDGETLRQLAGISYAASHNALIDSYEQYNSAATVRGGDEIVKLHPWPGFGTSRVPSNLFTEQEGGRGRVRWDGQLFPPTGNGASPAPATPKRMTLEEYQRYLQSGGR